MIGLSCCTGYAQFIAGGSLGTGAGNSPDGAVFDAAGNYYIAINTQGPVDLDPSAGVYPVSSTYTRGSILRFDANDHFTGIYTFNGTGMSAVLGIKPLPDGSMLISGMFNGTIDMNPGFGVVSVTAAGLHNYFVVKLDVAGNYAWHKILNPSSLNTEGFLLETDSNGNIILYGSFAGNIDLNPGPAFLYYNTSAPDAYFLIKLDAAGNYIWSRVFDSYPVASSIQVNSLVTDAYNNVYLSGHFSGTFDFDPGAAIASSTAGSESEFVLKLNTHGIYQWHKMLNIDYLYIQADGPHIVCFAKFTGNSIDMDANAGTYLLSSAHPAASDLLLAKYDTTDFNLVWANRIGGIMPENSYALHIDALHNIYCGGIFTGTVDFDPGPGVFTLADPELLGDAFMAKYTGNGDFVTAFAFKGPGDQTLTRLSSDAAGNILCAGSFVDSVDVDPSWGSAQVCTSNGLSDVFYTKLYGNNNFISGTVYLDANSNNTLDTGEISLPGQVISVNGNAYLASGMPGGFFNIPVDTGSFILTVPYPPRHHNVVPLTHNAVFTDLNGNLDSLNDFALQPIPGIVDLGISMAAITPARNNDYVRYELHYGNYGTDTASGIIRLAFDSTLQFDTALVMPVAHIAGGAVDTLVWHTPVTHPGDEVNLWVDFYLPLAGGMLPGDTLFFDAGIMPLTGADAYTADNNDSLDHIIVASYDPNIKEVEPAGDLPMAYLANGYLDYTVHFQNTGTDTAFNIYILDTIDRTAFDLGSFDMVSASHAYHYTLDATGKLRVYFDNIYLPHSTTSEVESHGFFKYRARLKSSLPAGTQVNNTAYIYFDYNAPIITNTTSTMLYNPVGLPGELTLTGSGIQAFPNPFTSEVTLTGVDLNKMNIVCYNSAGQKSAVNISGNTVSMAQNPKGIYLLVITGKNNSALRYTLKLVKE